EDQFDVVMSRGYYRRGILDDATGVIYGEATAEDQLLGTRLTMSSPIGIIYLGGAAAHTGTSSSTEHVEYATEGGYRFNAPSARWIPSIGVSLVHRSGGFYAPGTLQEARPTRVAPLVAGASVSQPLPHGMSLVAGGRYTMGATNGADRASAFAYLGAHVRGGPRIRTALNVDNLTERPEVRGQISLTFGIGGGRYRSSTSVPDPMIDLSMTQNLDVRQARGSAGVAITSIDSGTGTIGSAAGNARLTHPRGEAATAFRLVPGETALNDRIARAEARLRLGAGVYYADGVLGVGRPTTGSFAVIGPDPALPAETVLVNPRGTHAEARSGVLGGAVLTSIPDYYRKSIRIEVPGLPIDYALRWTDVVYESGYRSGIGLRAGGGQLLYGSGTLLDETGDPVALRVIRVTAGGETMYTGFTDEDGTFLVYDLMPGAYLIRFSDTGPAARFTLPPDADPPVQLGTLRLQSPAGGNS
ncbi:MAG: carboxypeptidase-like regulatory domain-containing protein, partial [Alkalispirochaeta sp.]